LSNVAGLLGFLRKSSIGSAVFAAVEDVKEPGDAERYEVANELVCSHPPNRSI